MMFRLILLISLFLPLSAQADSFATDWSAGLKSRARLVSAGEISPGHYRAGLEIELDPGSITYWRNPGEAGLPPILSFDGSQNLATSAMLFPAPKILNEAGALAFGYDSNVILPLDIVAKVADAPLTLTYTLDYAVCEKICIPAKAHGSLVLVRASSPWTAMVQTSLARVPVRTPVGQGALAIVALHPLAAAAKPSFDVEARVPAGERADLFVEGADGTYFTVEKLPTNEVTQHFHITLADMPQGFDPVAAPVNLTLVSAMRAIETTIRLDGAPAAP